MIQTSDLYNCHQRNSSYLNPHYIFYISLVCITTFECLVLILVAPSGLSSCSIQFSHLVVSDSLQLNGLQHARIPCPSQTPRAYSDSCPLSQWCHPTISPLVIPFSFCLQSFPASGSSTLRQLFVSGGQNIGASASALVLPMNIQGLFPLGLTGLISMKSKGLSRVYASTTILKHQLFNTQPSLWSNSHIHTWILEKP